MTPKELAEIKSITEAATPGPWEVYYQNNDRPHIGQTKPGNRKPWPIARMYCMDDEAVDTAKFVTCARYAVPALIAEIERLQEENERLRRDCCTRMEEI